MGGDTPQERRGAELKENPSNLCGFAAVVIPQRRGKGGRSVKWGKVMNVDRFFVPEKPRIENQLHIRAGHNINTQEGGETACF